MSYTLPYQFFGIWVSGDVAEITIYTDRFGKKVAFPKAPPEKPPSPRQVHQRQRFQTARANWQALAPPVKEQLELATKRGSIIMTGQNLFISVALRNTNDNLQTLARQTRTTLPTIAYVP